VAEGEPGSSCQSIVSLSSDVADPARDFRLLVEVTQPDSPPPLCTLTLQRCQRSAQAKTVGLASFCLPRLTPAEQQEQQQGQPPAEPPQAQQEQGTAAASGEADAQQQAPHDAPAPEKSQGVAGWIKSVFTPKSSSRLAQPAAELRQPRPKKELVLVVDCSGSMSGSPIEFAKNAALYFVRDLPVAAGVKFQIVLFGSSHKSMNAASLDYDAQAEQHAVDWINANVRANLGGTEIYQTMKAVYDTPIPEGYERQVIFLTDGGASDKAFIEELLQKHERAAMTTVQCLGVGHGVHRHLVDAMASTTGGLSQYVLSAQDIVPSCSFMKKCALSDDVLLQPRLKPKLCMLRSVPAVLPPRLFAGEPLVVLTEVVKAEKGATLELSAVRITGQEVHVTVPIPDVTEDLTSVAARAAAGTKVAHLEGSAIATLHAMAYIKCLLSGKSALHFGPDGTRTKKDDVQAAVQDQVVKLATEEGLVTPYTSAVGVLLQADPKDPTKTQQMEVPLKLPQGRTLWAACQAADEAPEGPFMPVASARAMSAPFSRAGSHRGVRLANAPPPPAHGNYRVAGSRTCGADIPPEMQKVGGGPVHFFGAEVVPIMQKSEGGPIGVSGVKAKKSIRPVMSGAAKGDGLGDAEPCASAALDQWDDQEGAAEEGVQDIQCALPNMCAAPAMAECAFEGAALHSMPAMMECAYPMPCSAAPAAPPPVRKPSTPAEMLNRLNLSRTIEGFWEAKDSLLEDLQAQRSAKEGGKEVKELVEQVQAAKPAALSSDVWTTVLVLAYLRQRLPQERPQWQGMEAKALSWLQAHWPQGQGVQSIGSCVLSAMKLV